MNYVFVKAAIFCGMAPLWIDPVRARIDKLLRHRSPDRLWPVLAVYRLTLVVLAFGVLGLKLPSDAANYYAAFAQDVLGPGRSASTYNPGFDYLLAGLLWLFGSPVSFVVLFVLAEIGAFILFFRPSKPGSPGDGSLLRDLALLWILNPWSVAFIALGGQDEALVLLAWCGVWWVVGRRRAVAAGAIAAIGLAFTKILGVFAILPAVDTPSMTRRTAVAYAVLVIAFIGACLVVKVPLLGFLQESRLLTPGNLWTFLTVASAANFRPTPPWQFAVGAVCVAAAWWYVRRFPIASAWQQILRSTGVTGAAFLIASPKAWTHYAVMFLPGVLFLLLTLPAGLRSLLLLTLLPASVCEPSLWFYFREGESFLTSVGSRVVMAAVDAVIVGGYAILIWHGLRLHRVQPAVAR